MSDQKVSNLISLETDLQSFRKDPNKPESGFSFIKILRDLRKFIDLAKRVMKELDEIF